MNELHNYLVVGAVLFALGAVGFLSRRNLIIMILSAEMMLQGVMLNLVAFSRWHQNFEGQAFAVFLVTVAACEAGLALALFVALFHRRHTLDASAWRDLGEEGWVPQDGDGQGAGPPPSRPAYPHLTPAGRVPPVPPPGSPPRV